jgi:hypothetical protein
MSTPIPFRERPLCTIGEGRQAIGVGLTKFYELIGGGLIETVMIGRRRYVRVPSLFRLADTDVDPHPTTPPRRRKSVASHAAA